MAEVFRFRLLAGQRLRIAGELGTVLEVRARIDDECIVHVLPPAPELEHLGLGLTRELACYCATCERYRTLA